MSLPRALVTGAGGTFGRFICAALVAHGFETLCVVRDAAKGENLLSFLAAHTPPGGAAGRARAVACDLSSRDDIARAIGDALGGAANNIRRTDELLQSLVDFNATQNIVTVRRSAGVVAVSRAG